MAYTKTNWVDDTAPYINAANLNKIEQGIEDAHNGVLATQLTGLIPINGTPLPSDSLLVAIGKLKNTADNQRNKKISKSNKSGYKNVNWCTRAKKWKVGLKVNGKSIHFGYFSDVQDANNATINARNLMHGEFSNHG